MQRIMLAMLLYEREHGTLPPAWSVDAAGDPLHSWRVLLLPYLGHEALYEKIRLGEPWDSEHNRQFHGEDMAVYRCPSDLVATLGQATYSVVVGPDMPFEAGQGKRLTDFGPDSDDMILLVERIDPVAWMDPTCEIAQPTIEKWTAWHTRMSSMMFMSSPPTPAPPAVIGGRHNFDSANFGLRSGGTVYLETDDAKIGAMLRGTNTDRSSER